MKVSINRQIVKGPWGGGNKFVESLARKLSERGHLVCFDLPIDLDVIVMVDPRHDVNGYSANHIAHYKSNPQTTARVLHRINECDKRKGTSGMDQILLQSNHVADRTVFISKWLAMYFCEQDFDKQFDVIYNGCDLNTFRPNPDRVLGDKIRLVTHHWSDNWMKGFDIYTQLDEYLKSDDRFEFTYIGRYNNSYTPKKTRLVSPLHGEALASELRKHDVYITASRWEPCGMHHIEGAASGMPVLYHSECGGINECCMHHGLEFESFDRMLHQLETVIQNYEKFQAMIDSMRLSDERSIDEYIKIIESM